MKRHPDETTPWCPECKGTGACQVCLGTGSRGYWWKRTCPACDGDRDCAWCEGTGDDPEARR
ncbi:MAG TPA: hypothetical protein VFZ68_17080 [Acidimicrobiales bacterium]